MYRHSQGLPSCRPCSSLSSGLENRKAPLKQRVRISFDEFIITKDSCGLLTGLGSKHRFKLANISDGEGAAQQFSMRSVLRTLKCGQPITKGASHDPQPPIRLPERVALGSKNLLIGVDTVQNQDLCICGGEVPYERRIRPSFRPFAIEVVGVILFKEI
jgi:hypothetical protein